MRQQPREQSLHTPFCEHGQESRDAGRTQQASREIKPRGIPAGRPVSALALPATRAQPLPPLSPVPALF
jgi:hypothetical protein